MMLSQPCESVIAGALTIVEEFDCVKSDFVS